MFLDSEHKFFLVDWVLPAVSLEDLRAAQRALEEAGRRLTAEGEPVRCLRSTYVPAAHRWLCLFAAPNEDAVRKTHEIAQIPAARIQEAIDLCVDDRLPT
ncbi:MAG: nickel-binding protein [Haloechinothrix sp.]